MPGRRQGVVFEAETLRFQDGARQLKPYAVQDTASQFVELTRRFSTGREILAVGSQVQVWLARPSGMALWTYDVVAEDTLQTPELGPVQAFHLRPRPHRQPARRDHSRIVRTRPCNTCRCGCVFRLEVKILWT